jgi:uncharacterized protein (TIGR02118 family)
MLRLLVLYGRPTDPDAFDRHYRQTHIGVAQRIPGLRRYTISWGLGAMQGESPYHLVAELDFDDRQALDAAISSAEGQAAVNDLANFATGGVTLLVSEIEDVTNPGQGPGAARQASHGKWGSSHEQQGPGKAASSHGKWGH